MVSANGLNHCPATPYMNATGTNTATIENVVAATARPISSVPSCDAVTWSFPISMWRTMFSRTTMASSIRTPIESERPRRDIVLSVNPKAQTAMNAASTLTGRARPVMTVDRHELRNRNTTSTVSTAPSMRASCTFRTAWATRTPASCTTSSLAPLGRRCCSVSIRALSPSLTWVVLYPLALSTSMPTASLPLNRAAVR